MFKSKKITIDTDRKKIQKLLERSVVEAIPRADLEKKLLSGEQLNIKLGIDPTSPNLHLGRAVTLWKLKDFQDLGHKITLIIGDFTGTIGDTSDKESERPMLDDKTVRKNLKTYAQQAGKILDMSKVEVVRNSSWLAKLGYKEVGTHADAFSVSDFISRELIKKRLEEGGRISLREFLYPLMQGYDSVAIKSDVEIGGTDQKFNVLAGRTLQKQAGQEPQSILLLGPLLEGTDGRKMSSSWGNTINLLDSASEIFGKTMSIRDELIEQYFIHTTRVEIDEIKKILKEKSPRDSKFELALKITEIYHGKERAVEAGKSWETQFSKKETPDNLERLEIKSESIVDVLVESGFTKSKNEARRKIAEGAVYIDGEKITEIDLKTQNKDFILKLGKKMIKAVKG